MFSILGPGIISAVADNDAGGVATYTVAASLYGYAAQFLIIPVTVLLGVTQEVGSRIAIVSRRGLADLIRERFGVKWSIGIFILLFITNQAVVIQNVSGIRASLTLLNLPYYIFLPLVIILIWLLLLKGNFKTIQRGLLILTLFYFVYLISAFQSHPNWLRAIENTFWPIDIKQFDVKYIFTLIAVLGTTITAWGQFFIQSFVKDKGLDVVNLKHEKFEVYAGAFITNFFSFMIVVAVSATIYANGISVDDAADAAHAITPFAGELAYILFSCGLFVASIMGASIVPLSTAYAFSEFFGFERSLDKSFSQSKMFYSFLIIQLIIGLIAALIPALSLFQLTLYASFLNGAILPVIFFFLIKFSNDSGIMGRHVNTKGENYILLGSSFVVLMAVLITTIGSFFIQ